MASDEDKAPFPNLEDPSKNHYGDMVAMDRSVGTLRAGLRKAGIAEDTLVWFCSDNGGLPKITPETVGGLRGFKGSLYEGGLRVPGILEWPAKIKTGRITKYPAVVMDVFPTIAEIVNLPSESMLSPQDGQSLAPLLDGEVDERTKPIPFHCFGNAAWLDYPYKLLHTGKQTKAYELYHLENDPKESKNLDESEPEIARRIKRAMETWLISMQGSIEGKDYPEGKVFPEHPIPRHWDKTDLYKEHFDAWRTRPEYRARLAH